MKTKPVARHAWRHQELVAAELNFEVFKYDIIRYKNLKKLYQEETIEKKPFVAALQS